MPLSHKERLYKLGQILTGFVNAKSPDDAVRSYFENLCNLFSFSAVFKTEIEERFPHLDDFEDSLSQLDRRYLALVIEEERIKKYLNNVLGQEFMALDHYIPEKNTLMLLKAEYEEAGLQDGVPEFMIHEEGPYPYRIKDLANYINNSGSNFYKDTCKLNFYKELKKLMKVGTEINRIKPNISDHIKNNPSSASESGSERYEEIKKLNRYVQKLQSAISEIFLAITMRKKLHDIKCYVSV